MTEPDDPDFIGRDQEVATVRRALSTADAGRPQFVLLTAPAGMGKTALLEHALAGVPHRRIRLIADELESSHPHAVLGQLATALRPGSSAWPLLGAGDPAHASSVAVGAELVRVLGDLDPAQLLVLTVEDAHWLEAAAAAAVQFAVRRLTIERAAVVVTTRGGERSVDFGWHRPANTAGKGTAIELGPLGDSDVGTMVERHHGRQLAPAALARLVQQTGGHPLHVRLVVKSSSWAQLSATSGPLPVSRTVTSTIIGSLTALAEPAQSVVAAAAVLGRPVDEKLLQQITGLDDPTAAIAEAVTAGLLRHASAPLGRTVSVLHPLIAAAVRQSLDPVKRRRYQHAVLPALADDAALQYRIAAAVGYDDDLAAEAEESAISRKRLGETDAAIALLLSAADLTADVDLRPRRFLRAVGLMATQGDIVRALSNRADALACPPSCERTVVLAALTVLSGQLAAAGELIGQARQELADAPDARLTASIDLLDATRTVISGAGGLDNVQRVLANSAALPGWRRIARVLGAFSHMMQDEPRQALALVQVSPAVGRAVEPGDVPLLAVRGGIALWIGQDTAAWADLAIVQEHIRAGRPVPALIALSLALIAEAHLATGRWSEAMTTVELLLAVEEGESRAVERPIVHAVVARVLAEHGQHERALEHLETARMWSQVLASSANRVYVALAATSIALLAGDHAAAGAALDEVNRADISFRAVERRLLRARTLLAAGRWDRAEQLASEVAGQDGWLGTEARLVLAELMLARSDAVAADAALRAASSAIPADHLYQRGREAQLRGELSVQVGHRASGITAITLARNKFASLGAWPWVASCENRLAELQGDAAPADPPGRLTDRELEVARLVALGLSNVDVAARLYVSRKAIEFHLTNVYAKLGISSRRQLADRLHRGAISSAVSGS